jgi:2-methylisocitrate lyase-like PEP mutase family enzyme
MAMRGVVDRSMIVDADIGFGNAMNAAHSAKEI